MTEPFVIVGANLAGGSAAAALREEGFEGELVLIGEEPEPPYERPPLSKAYLRGEEPFEKALVRPPDFYKEKDIDTRFGVRAERIDTDKRRVDLANGDSVPYEKVLIATGSRNRRIPIPGIDLEGVYGLRTVGDADRIKSEVERGRRVGLIGMGFIGAEVAASLRQVGVEVSAIEMAKTPLARVLGEEIGNVIRDFHSDHGVEMIFEDSVEAFEGSERVERIRTKGGRTIDCDFAVVGVGIAPVTEVVEGSPVEVDNGIVVDEFCRTNVPDVFAAGDVSNHYHPLFDRRIRVEHWQNALKQGPAAAKSMLGKGEPYDEVHWFWSDQYDYNIQYAGFHTEYDEMVIRGSLDERNFIAFYLKDARILAAVGFNRGGEVRTTMRIIKAQTAVDPQRLRDEGTKLRSLLS